MRKQLTMPITAAIIAAFLVLADFFVANLIYPSASFLWVSFIGWATSGALSLKEKVFALSNYAVGFFVALFIYTVTSSLEPILKTFILASCISVFIFNLFVVWLANLKRTKLVLSVPAIFIGIALSFSGLGVNLKFNSLESCATMLMILLVYGFLGLLAGHIFGVIGRRQKP